MKTKEQARQSGDVLVPPAATPGEDVEVKLVVRFGVGLVLVLLLVSMILIALMRLLATEEIRHDASVPPLAQHEPGRAPAGVRLQEQPFADVEQLQKTEHVQLDQYGWLDRKAGSVHIPIRTAMQLLVHRGLPARMAGAPAPAPATAAPEARPRPRPTAVRPKPRPTPRPENPPSEGAQ